MNTEIQTQSETVSESEALVLREDNEGLVTLTLNRPRQFNALSEEVLAALQEELDRIAEDQQSRLVVIAGNGKAFCAGHDLKQEAEENQILLRVPFAQHGFDIFPSITAQCVVPFVERYLVLQYQKLQQKRNNEHRNPDSI